MTSELSQGKIKDVSLFDLPTFGAILDPRGMEFTPWEAQPTDTYLKRPCNESENMGYSPWYNGMAYLGNEWYDHLFVNLSQVPPVETLKSINESGCYSFADVIAKDPETFMRVMRESYLNGKNNKKQEFEDTSKVNDFYQTYISPLNLTYYKASYASKPGMFRVLDVMFLNCDFASGTDFSRTRILECLMFEPMLTSHGICHSFNGLSVEEVYQPSPYLDMFQKVYQTKKNHDLRHSIGFGKSAGLYAILNSRPYQEVKSVGSKEKRDYSLAITNHFNAFDVNRNSFTLKPGYVNSIRIIPAEVVTTDSYYSLTKEQRKCRMHDETEGLKLLKTYTQNGCEFECAYEIAKQACFCIPWNYPRSLEDNDIPYCDMFGNFCFYMYLEKQSSYKACNAACLEDCSEVSYSVFQSKEILDADELCSTDLFELFIMEDQMRRDFLNAYESLKYGKPEYEDSGQNLKILCKEYIRNYVSIVNVEVATKTLMRSIKERRVSFSDRLAALGNIYLYGQ